MRRDGGRMLKPRRTHPWKGEPGAAAARMTVEHAEEALVPVRSRLRSLRERGIVARLTSLVLGPNQMTTWFAATETSS